MMVIDGIRGLMIMVVLSRQVVGEERDGGENIGMLVVGGSSSSSSVGREVLVVVEEVIVVVRHEKMIRHGHGRTTTAV